jgi:hypothetical protein
MSSVVLNADLVSLVSVVRRGAFAPAAYLGVFVVKSVVVMMEVQSGMRRGWPSSVTASRGDRFASPAGAPCVVQAPVRLCVQARFTLQNYTVQKLPMSNRRPL